MQCPKCNAEIPDSSKFCLSCGSAINKAGEPESPNPNYTQQNLQQPYQQSAPGYNQPAYQQPIPPYPQQPYIPEEYRPIGMWGYFGYELLFAIPFVGFILLIVFSFAASNKNLRNFARSYFCVLIIVLVIIAILLATGSGLAVFSFMR